jgi:TolB protein
MNHTIKFWAAVFLATGSLLSVGCDSKSGEQTTSATDSAKVEAPKDTLRYPEEKHFKNVRQLTFGGNNAEAYFSFDGKELSFQSDFAEWEAKCDQIFVMPISGTAHGTVPRISTGKGRTTCAYFLPDNQEILYASTHLAVDTCPAVPPRKVDGKYVWPVYDNSPTQKDTTQKAPYHPTAKRSFSRAPAVVTLNFGR